MKIKKLDYFNESLSIFNIFFYIFFIFLQKNSNNQILKIYILFKFIKMNSNKTLDNIYLF